MANDGRVREKAHLIRGVALCRMLRRISISICVVRCWTLSLALGLACAVALSGALRASAQTETPGAAPQAGASAELPPVAAAELKPAPATPIAMQKAELGTALTVSGLRQRSSTSSRDRGVRRD